ncbi:DinB family protein [Gracilibacillus sp. S3-1-1]|uniref:DinB family protein n=1 Tax=Gracilibacillus pellucidus TaxID=3095368 RepID=A0ACC6M7W8_9BACI|nr:DinB family protein [Gracilibacillus sp. S3-1-1]MDX8047076.1 DinB family protein [Gracilibacillus sp. S3-1-1]
MNKTLSQFEKMIDNILGLKEFSEEILSEPTKEGKWSIREIVGHLYYWDKFNLENMVPLMIKDADLPKFPDHDQHNEEAMRFIKDYSDETIIDNFVLTRKELAERISKLDEDVRFTIGGGKRKFSGESFTKIFIKHDAHHSKQITEKLHN